ncbi:hypothetical protein [Burkholderia gladioli]|uniref:hypothetical protein n=1 Tax=Burkholderia gladioli TaxID=28095 RepID=UPI00163E76BC|nr:hypothetical protein [Burkholderia gladioli]
MIRERNPQHHYPDYHFGDLIWGTFPHEDAQRFGRQASSERWMFVLRDLGRRVMVCYLTTNPELKAHRTFRLGLIPGGKVTYIAPDRWEVLDKSRIFLPRGVERIEFAHVLHPIASLATRGEFDGYSTQVFETVVKEAQRAVKRQAKLARAA